MSPSYDELSVHENVCSSRPFYYNSFYFTMLTDTRSRQEVSSRSWDA